jgi:trehalose-6-phosphate synthase
MTPHTSNSGNVTSPVKRTGSAAALQRAASANALLTGTAATASNVNVEEAPQGRILSVTHFLPVTARWKGALPKGVVTHGDHTNVKTKTKATQGTGHWEFERRRGHSAMYSGIASLRTSQQKHLHIGGIGQLFYGQGSTTISLETLTDDMRKQLMHKLRTQHAAMPVLLDEVQSSRHYEGYCKGGR